MAAATRGSLFHTASVPPKVTGSHTAATATATAHTNLSQVDLIQVIAQGGKVVWNLTSAGVVNVNPANPSKAGGQPVALLGQFFGSSFAAAFPVSSNPQKLDLYQVHDGSVVVFHVDFQGNAFTP